MALLALLAPGMSPPEPPTDLLTTWRAKLSSATTGQAVLVTCGDSLTDMDATTLA